MNSFRLLTYLHDGQPRAGVALGDRVFDGPALLGRHGVAGVTTTLGMLQVWDQALPALEAAAANPPADLPSQALAEVALQAPVQFPGAYFCAAKNYYRHSREMNANRTISRDNKQPLFFLKPGVHTTIGPGQPIRIPAVSSKIDWEIELAAVIGRRATQLSVENALSCVAGYTIVNDVSLRDLIHREDWKSDDDWFGCKVFEGSMPQGPWIVPARDIPDPQNVHLRLWRNGEIQQDSSTSDMMFSLAEQIEYVSRRLVLRPGDIIATGTPSGVGGPRGLFLKSGDVVRMEISGIGTMENPVE